METHANRKFSFWAILALVAVLAFAVATPSFAENVAGSATVTAGNLEILDITNLNFPETFLDGTNQTRTADIDISMTDFTGSGAGWQLQITSTSFDSGAHQLANTALSITGVLFDCVSDTCTNPTNGISYPLTVPAGAEAPTAVVFYDAAANTGMGGLDVTPTFDLAIPANTYVGTYNSTVTITLGATP